MGLDVYVQRCPDRKFARAQEEAFEKAVSGMGWEENKPLRAQFGMDEKGYHHVSDEKIELDSPTHPEHYFKIGYFRSSYNDGGFNSYADRVGIPTLNEIFDNEDGEYEFTPDWAEARERAIDALNSLRRKDFGFDVMTIDGNPFMGPPEITNENKALEAFRKQHTEWATRKEGSFEAYENRDGYFDVKGLTIHAALPGTTNKLGRPMHCTYLLVKRDKENWYAQALEIVIETCNHVLEQPDSANYYLHWSG